MAWVPESMDERTEVKLREAVAAAMSALGPEGAEKFLETFLLGMKDRLLAAREDNPARIKLLEIIRKRELGFE